MLRHAQECRERGYPFAADPSQQLARMDGETAGALITGADLLFTNDYELGLLQSKTGWTDAEILAQVGYRVTTHGPRGVEVVGRGRQLADRAGPAGDRQGRPDRRR